MAVCDRCDGDGKANGSDRPFEWSGPGTWPGPCPKCYGAKVLYSDMVTCPACQCDLDGIRSEQPSDNEANWPEWLSMGFCSPKCFSKSK